MNQRGIKWPTQGYIVRARLNWALKKALSTHILNLPPVSQDFNSLLLLIDLIYDDDKMLSSLILMPFSASAIFCLASSTLGKCFPLRTFFIRGDKNKVTQGEMGWIGRVGYGGRAVFGQKLLNTQHREGGCAHEMGKHVERVFKINLLKLNAACHSTSWYTDTEGFLGHSPTKGPPSRR